MKKLFIFLLLFGCTAKQSCEIDNTRRAFMGLVQLECSNDGIAWKNKFKKGCNHRLPGKFEVIDSKSYHYRCKGEIRGYPYLNDSLDWQYYFASMECKNKSLKPAELGFFVGEGQINRIGDL